MNLSESYTILKKKLSFKVVWKNIPVTLGELFWYVQTVLQSQKESLF